MCVYDSLVSIRLMFSRQFRKMYGYVSCMSTGNFIIMELLYYRICYFFSLILILLQRIWLFCFDLYFRTAVFAEET